MDYHLILILHTLKGFGKHEIKVKLLSELLAEKYVSSNE